MNIENVYGEIRPVFPTAHVSANRGLLFVHIVSNVEYRFYQNNGYLLVYKVVNGEEETNYNFTTALSDVVNGVEAIGNTVIIATATSIIYLLHKNGTYRLLGDKLPFPIITFSLADTPNGNKKDKEIISLDDNYKDVSEVVNAWSLYSDDIINLAKIKFTDYLLGNCGLLKDLQSIEDKSYFTFPFFVRYALRLYDGTITKHSAPIFLNPGIFTSKFQHVKTTVKTNKPNIYGDPYIASSIYIEISQQILKYLPMYSADLNNWRDIITSVDIFISNPIYTFNQAEPIKGMNITISDDNTVTWDVNYAGKTNSQLIDEIVSVAEFRLLKSLELSDFDTTIKTLSIPEKKLSTIGVQELMTDDYYSHDELIAEYTHTYNNRLNLSGVSKKIYGGYYNFDISLPVYAVIDNLGTVRSQVDYRMPVNDSVFIFHPNINAKFLTFFNYSNPQDTTQYTIPLKKHPSLMGSYYIREDLIPSSTWEIASAHEGATVEDINSVGIVTQIQKEKLYSSEVLNPFLFRPSGINTMPGKVYGTATTTEPMSQGQFGQFPLYVFTDRGIWALEISASGTYSTKQIISREVCTNPKSITQLKREVAFITEKGLCIISGAETELITSVLEDANYQQPSCNIDNLLFVTENTEFGALVSTEPTFDNYIQDARPVYDPINERIYLYNPTQEYSYIFNLQSKTWSKTDEQFLSDCNAYPEIFFEKSDGIYKPVLVSEATQRKVFFITRPIQLQELMFIVERLRMNATLTATNVKNVLALYASRDGINYTLVSATNTNILKMRGSGYKYYKIAFSGTMKNTDSITGLTLQYKLKYTNKLR